jgi:hypothetical protein
MAAGEVGGVDAITIALKRSFVAQAYLFMYYADREKFVTSFAQYAV